MDFKKLSDVELQDLLNSTQMIRDELNERRHKKQDDEIKKILVTDKCKKVQAKYKKVQERIKSATKPTEVNLTIPVAFTVESSASEFWKYGRLAAKNQSEVFVNKVYAVICKPADLNKMQRELLQYGLDEVVSKACGDICRLFPAMLKEQNACVVELNKVIAEAVALKLTKFYDLNGV